MLYAVISLPLLMMTSARRDIPYGLYHPLTHGYILIPAVYQNILLPTVQEKLAPDGERCGAVGA
jgi:hypothetical protein